MSNLTIDSALQKSLVESGGAVRLVTVDGSEIGFFVPAKQTHPKLPPGCEISEEEVDRRRQAGGYITTAELMKRLESL